MMWALLGTMGFAAYLMREWLPDRLYAPDGRDIWPRPRRPLRLYAPDGRDLVETLAARRVYAPDGVDLDAARMRSTWAESEEELSQEGIRWQRTWGPSLSPDVPVPAPSWHAVLGWCPPGPRTFAPDGRDLRYEARAEQIRRRDSAEAVPELEPGGAEVTMEDGP